MQIPKYPFTSKLLHRFVLQNHFVGKACFALETMYARNAKMLLDPVFITGLARAGTTLLQNILYESNGFSALTYRHMPFILMPNLWQKISAPFAQHKSKQERVHGDGVEQNVYSPEAFEEVFWQVFNSKAYVQKKKLLLHEPNEETLALFNGYMQHVQHTDGGRYLAKNNNNVLRLSSLQCAFPDAYFIIPIREPVQHAISLHRQHQHFCALQKEEPFVLQYMNMLGHYEFGLNHKPMTFSKAWQSAHVPDSLNYWLDYWLHVHEYLVQQLNEQTLIVCYEELCVKPKQMLRILSERIGQAIATPPENYFKLACYDVPDVDTALLDRAQKLHQQLLTKSIIPLT